VRHPVQTVVVTLFLFAAARTPAARGAEITAAGRQLSADLDAMDVEHL
jgi:hypothetical protein